MMQRYLYILFAILSVVVSAGCNPAGKIAVIEAEMPALYGLEALHGRAVVENGGARDLMIESARITVRYRDRELGAARLVLPVEIAAGTRARIRYDLALEGVSMSSLGSVQTRLFTNPDELTADVSAWVRVGAIRKKIELRRVPVAEIIINFTTL